MQPKYNPLGALRRCQAERDFESALTHIDKALAVRPSDTALRIRRGSLLRQARRIDESVAWLEGLRVDHPDDLQVTHEFASALRQAGLLERSHDLVDEILARDPFHHGALLSRVEIAIQRHAPDAAFAHLDTALEAHSEDIALRIRRGALLRQARWLEDSIAWLEALRTTAPEDLQVVHQLAVSLQHAGRVAESGRLVDEVLAREATHLGALLLRVDLALQQHMHDAALTHLDAALLVYPGDPALRVRRVALLRRLGQVMEARDYLPALPDSPPVRLERISTLLELGETDAAVEESAALARSQPLNLSVQTLWLKALRESGSIADVLRHGARLAEQWPHSAEIAVQRATCLLKDEGPESAIDLLDSLPAAAQRIGSVVMVRANAFLKREEYEASDALFAELQERGGLNLGAISGRFRVALTRGWEGPLFRQTLDQVHALAARHASELGHTNIERILLEVAGQVGNWPEMLTLAESLRRRQPRDAMLWFCSAKASFETGDLVGARRNLADFLKVHPAYQPAVALREELDLAMGDVDRYLDRRRRRLVRQDATNSRPHSDFARDLFMLGLPEEVPVAPSQRLQHPHDPQGLPPDLNSPAGVEDANPDNQAAPDQTAVARYYGTLSPRELHDLLDFESHDDIAGPASFTAAELAWRLCEERPDSFAAWRVRAARATYAQYKMTKFPYVAGRLGDLMAPVNIGPLGPLVADRQPFLMCSSHFGPRVFEVLDPHLPDAVYLVRQHVYTPVPGRMDGDVLLLSGDRSRAAVTIYNALRQGKCLMSSPDVPVGLVRGGRSGWGARGRIFGVPCAILDTVPKLSQGMKIPSFWVQTRWRGERMQIEIEPLPIARPDEATQDWCDRWAQAYLDKLAAIMCSRPENQNLRAPMWRYLLLKGMGKRTESWDAPQDGVVTDRPAVAAITRSHGL